MRCVLAFCAVMVLLHAACADESTQRAARSEPAQSSRGAGKGSDWPTFLGPTGDSKSTESGILTRWPAEGPPIVWQLALGTGYGMPAISDGRLFQFDRTLDERSPAVSRSPRPARSPGRLNIPAIFGTCTATTTARAARPWSTAIAFTSSAPRDAALSGRGRRQADLEGRHRRRNSA